MENLEIKIAPLSEKFDENDPRWMVQKDELTKNLKSEIGDVRKEVIPVEGMKGGMEAIILAIGGSGLIPGLVEIVKTWITRDRTRSVEVTIDSKNGPVTIKIDATGLSKNSMQEFLQSAIDQQK